MKSINNLLVGDIYDVSGIVAKRNIPELTLLTGNQELSEDTFDRIFNTLEGVQFDELDLIFQSYGGSYDLAFHIAAYIRKAAKKLNVILPNPVFGPASLIALCGDKLILSKFAFLRPLDPQLIKKPGIYDQAHSASIYFDGIKFISEFSQNSLSQTYKKMLEMTDQNLEISTVLSEAARYSANLSDTVLKHFELKNVGILKRELESAEQYVRRTLMASGHFRYNIQKFEEEDKEYFDIAEDQVKRVANQLVNGYTDSNYLITVEELDELGFNVEQADSDLCWDLYEITGQVFSLESPRVDLIEPEKQEKPKKAKKKKLKVASKTEIAEEAEAEN